MFANEGGKLHLVVIQKVSVVATGVMVEKNRAR